MKIRLIAVDKVREKFYSNAIDEYSKRLKNFEIIEVKKSGKQSIDQIVDEEGKNLLKQVKKNDFVVALDPQGEQMSSGDLAVFCKASEKSICFLIGGTYGLSDEVKKRSNRVLSLSQFTFPHELARVLLVEQLYRAQTIIDGKNYHK